MSTSSKNSINSTTNMYTQRVTRDLTSISNSQPPSPSLPLSPPVPTEFTVNFGDPWTIAAISLLAMLSIVSVYRIYYTTCKTVTTNKNVPVYSKKIKKSSQKSIAQMRGF